MKGNSAGELALGEEDTLFEIRWLLLRRMFVRDANFGRTKKGDRAQVRPEKPETGEKRRTLCGDRCKCACMRVHTGAASTGAATRPGDGAATTTTIPRGAHAHTLYRRLRTFHPRRLKGLPWVACVLCRPWRRIGGPVHGRARLKRLCQRGSARVAGAMTAYPCPCDCRPLRWNGWNGRPLLVQRRRLSKGTGRPGSGEPAVGRGLHDVGGVFDCTM